MKFLHNRFILFVDWNLLLSNLSAADVLAIEAFLARFQEVMMALGL